MGNDSIIQIRSLGKVFPGVTALEDVSFDVARGSVHCIVGENGAGKSTFIKILTGALVKSSGTMLLDGSDYAPKSVRNAMERGISVLYQELNVVDDLTVRENLCLGKEPHLLGFISGSKGDGRAEAVLARFDPGIKHDDRVGDLRVAQKQIIEIVKAVSAECSVLVMDEPTAALSEEEIRRLFAVIGDLKRIGTTTIFISHKLAEIFEIGDFVSVFRDGRMIETKAVADISASCRDTPEACVELVRMMLGRVVTESYAAASGARGGVLLAARGLRNARLKDVSFELHSGEILGFYGLIGAGKTEIARALYGIDRCEGEILLRGRRVSHRRPREAIMSGISLVPEERRGDGIFGKLPIRANIPMMRLQSVLRGGLISRRKEIELADRYMTRLSVNARDREQEVGSLSGGNQQKVVIAKCLNRESEVFLLDEPTRGVDVGAKKEIHDIIRTLAKGGAGIIVFSSELPEVAHLCDRIALMHEGRLRAIVENDGELDPDRIMAIVAGGEARV